MTSKRISPVGKHQFDWNGCQAVWADPVVYLGHKLEPEPDEPARPTFLDDVDPTPSETPSARPKRHRH